MDEAHNGQEALARVIASCPDAVILDLGLPDVDGKQAILTIREKSQAPIIVLSGRDSEAEKIRALDAGADDYLTKPFAFAELVARIHALGRRSTPAVQPVLEHDGLVLDVGRHTAVRDGRVLGLTPKEFAVLHVLLRAGGQVVSTEELLERAWDEHADPFSHVVKVTVMTLRRKLGAPPVIQTVPRAGYRIGAG